MTILGLDVGHKRVGLALSDVNCILSTPFKTVERAGGEAEREILMIMSEREVKTVVVGLPLDEDGGRTSNCEMIERFVRRLSRRAEFETCFVDEYLSTEDAKQRFIEARKGKKSDKLDGMIDAFAASSILQSFLDGRR